jgi:MFS family permease
MKRIENGPWAWLGGVVIAHLGISLIHGAAHAQANVPMSQVASLFVFVVILAGPLIGLALTLRSRRVGAWLIGITMVASLVFGLVNHFVLASPDHVSHVDPRWQPLFAATAVLLAITEALGAALAIRVVRERSLT